MADGIKWRPSELARIANEVNRAVCVPLAERVAAAAGDLPGHPELAGFVHVVVDERAGRGWARGDWAHARVVSYHPAAMALEAKHGVLGRALGAT